MTSGGIKIVFAKRKIQKSAACYNNNIFILKIQWQCLSQLGTDILLQETDGTDNSFYIILILSRI